MKPFLYTDLERHGKRHWWHLAKRETVGALIMRFWKKGKPILLDIGCATGINLAFFSKFSVASGIDKSALAIKMCRKKALRNVKVATAEKTGFRDQSFEVLTMLDILEHTEDEEAIKEAHRILKKRGLVVATVPALNFIWSKWDKTLGHKRRYSRSSLISLFETNDFKILFITYMYSFLLIPLILIRSVKTRFPVRKYGSDFNINNPV